MKFFLLTVILFILACTQSDDGPISIYPDEMAGEYSGFVLKAELDSGSSIHLRSESLQVTLDSIWTLSNCFLDKLFLEERIEDTILYLEPKVEFSLTSEDCASPLFFPETLIYMHPSESWAKVRSIVVLDSKGEAEDSVALRSGEFIRDSLKIYLDSNFANPYLLPRRTKGTPSVLKTVDSLEERVFYYRLMPSNCGYIIDSCETILDTIYPAQWSLRDTNLVPIRKTCKDSTMRYCLQRDWVDDSLGVGKLKEKLDTLWFSSWYLVEEFPEGGMANRQSYSSPIIKRSFQAEIEYFKPETKDDFISSENSDLWILNLATDSWIPLEDDLEEMFNEASIGLDSL